MAQVVHQSQNEMWKVFQRLLGVEQPPVAPTGQTPQQVTNVNPFAPEFLESMKKFGSIQNSVPATPMPQQGAFSQQFKADSNYLPQDSYAAAIKSMVQNHRR